MDYWQTISVEKARQFTAPQIDCQRPEQKALAGKIAVIGGNENSFAPIIKFANTAKEAGIDQVKAILPAALSTKINPAVKAEGLVFVGDKKAQGFEAGAIASAKQELGGLDYVVWAGEMGRSQGAKEFLRDLIGDSSREALLTRDAVDLALEGAEKWLEQDNMLLILSLAQLKKLAQVIYYPKMLNLTMPLNQIVEFLHKFTLSYPVKIMLLAAGQVNIAQNGDVRSVSLEATRYSGDMLKLFQGDLAIDVVKLSIWNKGVDFIDVATCAVLL